MKKTVSQLLLGTLLFSLSGVYILAEENKAASATSQTRGIGIDEYDLDCYDKRYTSHGDIEADDDVNTKMTSGYSNRNHMLGLYVTDKYGEKASASCSDGGSNTAKLKTKATHLHYATGTSMY